MAIVDGRGTAVKGRNSRLEKMFTILSHMKKKRFKVCFHSFISDFPLEYTVCPAKLLLLLLLLIKVLKQSFK